MIEIIYIYANHNNKLQSMSSCSAFCAIQHLRKQNFMAGSVLPGGRHRAGRGALRRGREQEGSREDPAPPWTVAGCMVSLAKALTNTPLGLGSFVREGF